MLGKKIYYLIDKNFEVDIHIYFFLSFVLNPNISDISAVIVHKKYITLIHIQLLLSTNLSFSSVQSILLFVQEAKMTEKSYVAKHFL